MSCHVRLWSECLFIYKFDSRHTSSIPDRVCCSQKFNRVSLGSVHWHTSILHTSSIPDTQVFYTQVRFPTHKFDSRAARDIIMFDSQRGGATMKEILKIRLFIGCTWHHYVWQPKRRGYDERNFFENKTVDFFGYLKRTLSAKAKVNAKRPRLTYGKENGPGHDKRFQ